MGPYVKYEVQVGDRIFLARGDASSQTELLKPGDAVVISWQLEDAHVVLGA